MFQVVRADACPGLDAGERRLLREVIADRVLDEGEHGGVVGDARAGRVHDRDAGQPACVQEARHAEDGVGPKREGVQEVVVDLAVQDVDTPSPARAAQVYVSVVHQQVRSRDEFHPGRLGQEGVLPEARAVGPRREQGDAGVVAPGCEFPQGLEQGRRVDRCVPHGTRVVRRTEAVPEEAVVRGHAGAARRAAHVVAHDPEPPGRTRDVDAAHRRGHAVGPDSAAHLDAELGTAAYHGGRNDAVPHDRRIAVEVGDQVVQRPDALFEPGFEKPPFRLRQEQREPVRRWPARVPRPGRELGRRERGGVPLAQRVAERPPVRAKFARAGACLVRDRGVGFVRVQVQNASSVAALLAFGL